MTDKYYQIEAYVLVNGDFEQIYRGIANTEDEARELYKAVKDMDERATVTVEYIEATQLFFED